MDTDSSWYDLTETTQETLLGSQENQFPGTNFHAGDNVDPQPFPRQYYENRISKLLNIIDDLKQENTKLKENMEQCQRDLNLRKILYFHFESLEAFLLYTMVILTMCCVSISTVFVPIFMNFWYI